MVTPASASFHTQVGGYTKVGTISMKNLYLFSYHPAPSSLR